MSRIITTTDDADAFNRIIDLVGTSATPAEVDNNSLFRAAEAHIIGQIPAAALPSGRSHAKRDTIVSALEFCAAWYMKSGGGKTATKGETIAGGARKSITESIGEISKREEFDTGGSTSVTVLGIDEQIDFFKQQCDALLEELGVTPPTSDNRFYVGKTRSRRKSTYRDGRK